MCDDKVGTSVCYRLNVIGRQGSRDCNFSTYRVGSFIHSFMFVVIRHFISTVHRVQIISKCFHRLAGKVLLHKGHEIVIIFLIKISFLTRQTDFSILLQKFHLSF